MTPYICRWHVRILGLSESGPFVGVGTTRPPQMETRRTKVLKQRPWSLTWGSGKPRGQGGQLEVGYCGGLNGWLIGLHRLFVEVLLTFFVPGIHCGQRLTPFGASRACLNGGKVSKTNDDYSMSHANSLACGGVARVSEPQYGEHREMDTTRSSMTNLHFCAPFVGSWYDRPRRFFLSLVGTGIPCSQEGQFPTG